MGYDRRGPSEHVFGIWNCRSAVVITERDSGRSRGFGFVEMEDGADEAIEALNGQDMQGRAIRVNEAKSKEGGDRGGRGGRSF